MNVTKAKMIEEVYSAALAVMEGVRSIDRAAEYVGKQTGYNINTVRTYISNVVTVLHGYPTLVSLGKGYWNHVLQRTYKERPEMMGNILKTFFYNIKYYAEKGHNQNGPIRVYNHWAKTLGYPLIDWKAYAIDGTVHLAETPTETKEIPMESIESPENRCTIKVKAGASLDISYDEEGNAIIAFDRSTLLGVSL